MTTELTISEESSRFGQLFVSFLNEEVDVAGARSEGEESNGRLAGVITIDRERTSVLQAKKAIENTWGLPAHKLVVLDEHRVEMHDEQCLASLLADDSNEFPQIFVGMKTDQDDDDDDIDDEHQRVRPPVCRLSELTTPFLPSEADGRMSSDDDDDWDFDHDDDDDDADFDDDDESFERAISMDGATPLASGAPLSRQRSLSDASMGSGGSVPMMRHLQVPSPTRAKLKGKHRQRSVGKKHRHKKHGKKKGAITTSGKERGTVADVALAETLLEIDAQRGRKTVVDDSYVRDAAMLSRSREPRDSGITVQLGRYLQRGDWCRLLAMCQRLASSPATLEPALPMLIAARKPALTSFVGALAARSPRIAHLVRLYTYKRACFGHMDDIVAPLKDDALITLCESVPFVKGEECVLVGALHPISTRPIFKVRCDHVFQSLARPVILSLFERRRRREDSRASSSESMVTIASPPERPTLAASSSSSASSVLDAEGFFASNDVSDDDCASPRQSDDRETPPPQQQSKEERDDMFMLSTPRVLLKRGEDIYHEAAIQMLFRMFNEIWAEKLGRHYRPRVETFAETPAGVDMGFLEIVDDVDTLENVERAKFEAITHPIKFIRTTCGWSLACYLLGISDRHRENTLVRLRDSAAIPIDFGFMLGVSAPSVNTYMITLSHDMYKFLAARNMWSEFALMWLAGFDALRSEARAIIAVARLLFAGHRDVDFVDRFLCDRLLLAETSSLAALRRITRRLRHAPVCQDTASKINSHQLNKAFLARHGQSLLVRLIVESSLNSQSIKSGRRFGHYRRVAIPLPPVGNCRQLPLRFRQNVSKMSLSVGMQAEAPPNNGQLPPPHAVQGTSTTLVDDDGDDDNTSGDSLRASGSRAVHSEGDDDNGVRSNDVGRASTRDSDSFYRPTHGIGIDDDDDDDEKTEFLVPGIRSFVNVVGASLSSIKRYAASASNSMTKTAMFSSGGKDRDNDDLEEEKEEVAVEEGVEHASSSSSTTLDVVEPRRQRSRTSPSIPFFRKIGK
jgi:Phosphatidylinositol 3- and 4-kinase